MNFFCIFTSCDFKRNNIEEEEFRKHLNEHHADEILEISKKENCYKVMLQSSNKRKENHVFYESCGFSGDKIGFKILCFEFI